MLSELSQGDFEFYRNYAKEMQNCHDKEFMQAIDPALLRAMYRGKNKKENEKLYNAQQSQSREHFLTLSRLFQASNTILPNLYYQNPRVMVSPSRASDPESAALMSALQNYYMKELKQKEENQEAVMNAWFFGLGWKKQGYRVEFAPKIDDPESIVPQRGMMGMVRNFLGLAGKSESESKPDSNESKERPEIVEWEGPFNSSESPMNVMTDHKADLRNRKVVLHRIPRTLYELKTFGNYDEAIMEQIFSKMKYSHGSRLEDRDISLMLNELHIQQRNGIWILTWVDEHPKALRYDKSTNQDKSDGFEPLVFTNEPGVRYPISHMKVAAQVQEHIDYLATIYIRMLDSIRNLMIVNQNAIAPGMRKAVEANRLRGLVWANKTINAGDFHEVRSSPVSSDLPALMQMLTQNVTEIMGSDEQTVAGRSVNKTLGQDKMAQVGTQIRESGMLDKVRDWVIRQVEAQGKLLQQYSNSELNVIISGKDYIDKKSGQPIQDKWVSFMSEQNPIGAKEFLNGDFEYNINIYEAVKPDSESQRRQYMELFQITSSPMAEQALLRNNKRFRNDLLIEETIKTFDAIPTPERFLEDLDSTQVAAIQTEKAMQGGMMMPSQSPQAPKPSKEINAS